MKQSKPKIYKAKYLNNMQQPDANGFYDKGFAKVPGINAEQLNNNISIQN